MTLLTNSIYLPKRKTLWLLFDLANGHPESHRYAWWFDSRSMAREFKKEHMKMKYSTNLYGPVKATVKEIK